MIKSLIAPLSLLVLCSSVSAEYKNPFPYKAPDYLLSPNPNSFIPSIFKWNEIRDFNYYYDRVSSSEDLHFQPNKHINTEHVSRHFNTPFFLRSYDIPSKVQIAMELKAVRVKSGENQSTYYTLHTRINYQLPTHANHPGHTTIIRYANGKETVIQFEPKSSTDGTKNFHPGKAIARSCSPTDCYYIENMVETITTEQIWNNFQFSGISMGFKNTAFHTTFSMKLPATYVSAVFSKSTEP